MFTRRQNRLVGAAFLLSLSFSSALAQGQGTYSGGGGLLDAYTSSVAQHDPGAGNNGLRGTFLRSLGRVVEHYPQQRRSIIGLAGRMGIVVDHSSGLPRFRGLALTSSEAVRFEANGRVSANFDDFRGQISLHLNF